MIGADGERPDERDRTAVVGDGGGEALQKNNGTMVPPTLDEAGIIIGASARLAGRGIVQGNGTIGDNRQVGLDEDANLVGGRRERGRRHRGHTPPRSRTRHRPAEGPGVERNAP